MKIPLPPVPEGHKVRTRHARRLADTKTLRKEGLTFEKKGGITIVQVIDAATNVVVAEGQSVCSDLDQFDKRLGKVIALGRALKALEKEEP